MTWRMSSEKSAGKLVMKRRRGQIGEVVVEQGEKFGERGAALGGAGGGGGGGIIDIYIMIDGLAEEGDLQAPGGDEFAGFFEDGVGGARDFRAAGVGDDAVGAELVAAADDADVGLALRPAAGARRSGRGRGVPGHLRRRGVRGRGPGFWSGGRCCRRGRAAAGRCVRTFSRRAGSWSSSEGPHMRSTWGMRFMRERPSRSAMQPMTPTTREGSSALRVLRRPRRDQTFCSESSRTEQVL